MKANIEAVIIDARPHTAKTNRTFVSRTLAAVREASTHETFERIMRTIDATKKERFIMKLKHAPKLAIFGVAAIVLGGSAYAAANWFGTQTQLQTNQNTVTVSAKDCPTPLWQAIQQNYPASTYSLSETYKIVDPSAITPTQIEQAQLATCEQRAIDALAHKAFPNSYFGYDSHTKAVPVQNSLYSAMGTYGTISAINGQNVTIADIPANYINKSPARLTVALTLTSDTQVLSGGQTTNGQSLAIGDQVYFVFQKPSDSTDDATASAIPTDTSKLLVISKTQYDYRPLDLLFKANNSGAVHLERSNDYFAG